MSNEQNSIRVIDIFVNKHFEIEPFMAAMTNFNKEYDDMPYPVQMNVPNEKRNIFRMEKPRAIYEFSNKFNVNIWCTEDITDSAKSGSNSQAKADAIPKKIDVNADLVISVSTSESAPNLDINGSVLIGKNFFLYDVHQLGEDPDPTSESHLQITNNYYQSKLPQIVETILKTQDTIKIISKFMKVPNNSGKSIVNSYDVNNVSVGVVNVTNYSAYKKADPAVYEKCIEYLKEHAMSKLIARTIETAHGIVAMSALEKNIPALFVSPITDRFQCFDEDVGTSGIQNYYSAYNAGISVGEFLYALSKTKQ